MDKDYKALWNMLLNGLRGMREGFRQLDTPKNRLIIEVYTSIIEYMEELEK